MSEMTETQEIQEEQDAELYVPLDAFTLKVLEQCPPSMADQKGSDLHFKAIFYGDFGTWKTTTSCRFGRTLILSQDPGWKVYKNHPELEGLVDPRPFVGYRQLEAYTKAIIARHPDFVQYDTFVIDTLSGIQEEYVDSVLRGSSLDKKTRPVFTPNSKEARINLPLTELPGRDDYHLAKNVLRPTIRALNTKAPVNVIYITHEREPSEEELSKKSGPKYKRPSVTEALFYIVARDVDLLGHFEQSGDDPATISFRRLPGIVAKSRILELNGKKIPATALPECIRRWQNGERIFPEKEKKS